MQDKYAKKFNDLPQTTSQWQQSQNKKSDFSFSKPTILYKFSLNEHTTWWIFKFLKNYIYHLVLLWKNNVCMFLRLFFLLFRVNTLKYLAPLFSSSPKPLLAVQTQGVLVVEKRYPKFMHQRRGSGSSTPKDPFLRWNHCLEMPAYILGPGYLVYVNLCDANGYFSQWNVNRYNVHINSDTK